MSNWKTNNQQYGQNNKTNSIPKKKIGKSTVEFL